MSGPIEVGQVWKGARVETGDMRIDAIKGDQVTYSRGSESWTVPAVIWQEQVRLGAVVLVAENAPPAKPTIPLRIRVGVTASGEWSAVGGSKRVLEAYTYGADTSVTDDLANAAEEDVAAWHWITAEVPMPETEQGDVAGEVEQPCAGMPSDQKGAK